MRILPQRPREPLRQPPSSPAGPWTAATPSTRSRPRTSSTASRTASSDLHAAPLLCAGIIGFRSLRLSGIRSGQRLGLYGFGAAAHVAIQVARHWGAEVYAITRDARHRRLALDLGAVWAGGSDDMPPAKLDAAIIFAPAGELVISALRALTKGGTVALGRHSHEPHPAYRLQPAL